MSRTPYICTVAQLRDDGIPTRYTDDFLTNKILMIEDYWEDPIVSGWWFQSRTKTYTLDGNDQDYMVLPVPIITITAITIDGVAQTLAYFTYYPVTDEIQNMHRRRIEYIGYGIYDSVRTRAYLFRPGRESCGIFVATNPRNVTITGTFGCVASDSTVPVSVNRASRKWVVRELEGYYDYDAREEVRAVTSIKRLGMSKNFAPSTVGGGITGDAEIDRVIAMYSPRIVGAS